MRRRFFSSLCRQALRDQRGTVSTEMVLVTLILSALLFGTVEVTRYALLRYYLDRATYHAARYLALNPNETEIAQAMVLAEVGLNTWDSVDDVQLYVKSARRDGQCLLVVEARAEYTSTELKWLLANPSSESVQVWPQADGCGEVAVHALPTRTPNPTLTATAKSVTPILLDEIEGTAVVNANIRLGPGFEYAIVGRLNEKEVVQVRGRDATATWLQIVPERVGWVYAPLIQLDAPVSSLKIVSSPPRPLTTPAPLPRLHFDSVPRALKLGECAMLKWDAVGANFVTLNEANVALYGERKVCPTQDTAYVLSAGYDQNRFYDREVKILIYPASDP